MESKKVNIFAFVMVFVMCAFSIYIGITNKAKNGENGKSSYELAVQNGYSGSEVEYLQSLNGKDGENITIEDIYEAYLNENELDRSSFTLSQFIEECYPDLIIDSMEEKTLTKYATNNALRSTVDICYSYYMDSKILQVQDYNSTYFVVSETTNAPIGVAAGSGVIYAMTDEVAYIVTNFHIAYCDNYSNDPDYTVYYYYSNSSSFYFTAKYDESQTQTIKSYNYWNSIGFNIPTTTYSVISKDYINSNLAPLHTHFLDSYNIYLNGYQTEEYAVTATFVGGSAENDIAVLKVEKNGSLGNALLFEGVTKNSDNSYTYGGNYRPATIGDSTEIDVGDGVIAIGNPLIANTNNVDTSDITTVAEYVDVYEQTYIDALCLTCTDGVVSSVSEDCAFESMLSPGTATDLRLIRVSSAINAGNSGGGLYDIHGNLIGIVNGKVESASYDNVGYAIPINIASAIADQVISQCDGNSEAVSIKIINGEALGITVKNNKTGETKPYFDLAAQDWVNRNGVEVADLTISGKAIQAGLEEGDIIESIEFDGKKYYIYNDYEFDNVLLKVTLPETSKVIKFNIKKTQGNSISGVTIVEDSVEITITSDDFKTIS